MSLCVIMWEEAAGYSGASGQDMKTPPTHRLPAPRMSPEVSEMRHSICEH